MQQHTMKKIILFSVIFSIFFSITSHSQNVNLNSAISYYEDYTKFNSAKSLPTAKEKIDLAAANETTKDKFKTWFYRGQIYLALFDLNLKNEMNKSTETDNNKKLIAAYNVIPMTEVDEALVSFKKEIELDVKKIYLNEANAKIKVIADHYNDKAYSCLVNKNYSETIVYYEKAYDIKKMNAADSVTINNMLNNMAIAAVGSKNYKKASEYYNKLIELNYKPENCYLAMIQMYNEAGDTAAVRNTILKSVAAMPGSYLLLIEKINLYLKDGKSTEAIESINQALVKSPNNHELHLVLGQTYNKMAFPKNAANKDLPKPSNFGELVKKAEDEFTKALQIKPDYFYGQYSLGALYVGMATDVLKKSENMKDPAKIKIEENKADKLFEKAIPVLEKAHELEPTDKDTMRVLRQLYARTGQGESEKYKKLNEALKN